MKKQLWFCVLALAFSLVGGSAWGAEENASCDMINEEECLGGCQVLMSLMGNVPHSSFYSQEEKTAFFERLESIRVQIKPEALPGSLEERQCTLIVMLGGCHEFFLENKVRFESGTLSDGASLYGALNFCNEYLRVSED